LTKEIEGLNLSKEAQKLLENEKTNKTNTKIRKKNNA
jgi:hypothetical protein